MSNKTPYYKSDTVGSLTNYFLKELVDCELIKENSQKIKSSFFNIFAKEKFLYYYKMLATEVANFCYGNIEDTCLQITPTPRIFFSGSHGTSIHCDYWYGHGESAYTIWVPLKNCLPGSTFYADHFNKLGYDYKTQNFKVSDLDLLRDKLSHPEFYILPPKDSCYLFNSGVLHGSTINSQKLTRLSLDFRISKVNDKTSTKDLDNYFHYEAASKEYKIPLHPFHKKPVLKYICGGMNKNTYAQHVCIDASAKRYNFILVDQEAEIERYGSPIIDSLLENGLQLSNQYSGLVISSINILSSRSINLLKKSDLKVWSALENKFLN
tara:strand:- start:1845 stop:2813 length:969 start_codon:yes stop_codon:yes gene_type:complete